MNSDNMSGDYFRSSPQSRVRTFSHDENDYRNPTGLYASSMRSGSHHSSPSSHRSYSLSVSPRLSPNEREKFSVYGEYYKNSTSPEKTGSPDHGSYFGSHITPPGSSSYSFRKKKQNRQEPSITRSELLGIVASALLSLVFGALIIVALYFALPLIFGSLERTLGNFSQAYQMIKGHKMQYHHPERDSKVTYIYHSDTNTFSVARKTLSLSSLLTLTPSALEDIDSVTSTFSNETFSVVRAKSLPASDLFLSPSSAPSEPELYVSLADHLTLSEALDQTLQVSKDPSVSVSSFSYSPLSRLFDAPPSPIVPFTDLFSSTVCPADAEGSCSVAPAAIPSFSDNQGYSVQSSSLFKNLLRTIKESEELSNQSFLRLFSQESLERGHVSISDLTPGLFSSTSFYLSLRSHQSLLLSGMKLWVAFPASSIPLHGFSLDRPLSSWLSKHQEFYFEPEDLGTEGSDAESANEKETHPSFQDSLPFLSTLPQCYERSVSDFLRDFSRFILAETDSEESRSDKVFLIIQRPGQLVSFPSGWIHASLSFDEQLLTEEGALAAALSSPHSSSSSSSSSFSAFSVPQFSLELEGEQPDSTQSLYYLSKAYETMTAGSLEESVKLFKILQFFEAYELKTESKPRLPNSVTSLELLSELLPRLFSLRATQPECTTAGETTLQLHLLYNLLQKNPQNLQVLRRLYRLLLDSALEELSNQEPFHVRVYEYCLNLVRKYGLHKEVLA